MPIRTLIVDDEPLARRKLRRLLGDRPDFDPVGEARDGDEAVRMVETLRPDLLLLDVQMPEVDGFDVVAALPEPPPAVVFVTAFDEHAVKAFEVQALDYLVKPFDRRRLNAALDRARQQIETAHDDDLRARLSALLRQIGKPSSQRDRLIVEDRGRLRLVRLEDLGWIEACGNYVRLHRRDESWLYRTTMKSLESRLDGSRFIRIHRSTIVNLDRIVELRPLLHGDYRVLLEDGTALKLSRTYRSNIAGIE